MLLAAFIYEFFICDVIASELHDTIMIKEKIAGE